MRKSLTSAVCMAVAAVVAVGAPSPANAATTSSQTTSVQQVLEKISTTNLSPATKALLAKVQNWTAADWKAMRTQSLAATEKAGAETEWLERAAQADDECTDTDFGAWVDKALGFQSWTPDEMAAFDFLASSGALSLSIVDSIFYGTESTTDTFGPNGEYTNVITSEMKDLKRFWDIDSDAIELIPMHGKDVFSSRERVARAFTFMFGPAFQGADEENLAWADLILATLPKVASLQMGANPVFSLNAVALGGDEMTPRIVMGDGIMQALTGLGLGDAGPQMVLAHEYGHQVQYATDSFPEGDDAAASRHVELEADAYSAYYLTHSRGAALNTRRVAEAAKSAWEVGDCAVTQPGHHGTPDQRERAVFWAASVADSASNQGHILPNQTFHHEFEDALPGIVTG